MALLLADGFDCYANDTQWIESGWARQSASVPAIHLTEGRFGGGCIKATSNSQARVGVYVAQGGTVIVGFSYKHDGLGTAADTLLIGRSTFGAQLFRLEHNTTGDLKAFNNPNTQVGSTATAALAADTWYWIECKVVLGTTASDGSIEVKVDGTTLITATSIDTFVSGEHLVAVKIGGGDGIHWIDDVVIMDAGGSTMNNFIGPTRIDTLSPNAAGGTTNWTAVGAGSQLAAVDDAANATNDDTDYIESKTAAQEARFGLADLTVEPNNIWGVQVRARTKKEDAGPRTVRTLINSNSVEALGTTRGAPTNYAWVRGGPHYVDPNTSAAFNAAGINALQAGVEIVA